MKSTAIILAGGSGTRMKSKTKKQYMPLCGRPLLFYAVSAFEKSCADEIVIVTGEGDEKFCRETIVEPFGFKKVVDVIAGGAERFNSVMRGLEAAGECDVVAIHDGARPLIDPETINESFKTAQERGACVTAVPVKDTIKLVAESERICETPDRSGLWIAQTPQTFRFDLIKEAYRLFEESADTDVTDDAQTVERYTGAKVFVIRGSYKNIKITTPEDMIMAEALMRHNAGTV